MVQRILLYATLCAVGAVLLAPFAWLLSTALKAESADLFAHPPQWIPDPSSGATSPRLGTSFRLCAISSTPSTLPSPPSCST